MELRENAFQSLSVNQRALLEALISEEAAFLVIGGYALRAHGHLRVAWDLDVLVAANSENADKVIRALKSTPAAKMIEDRTHEDLCKPRIRFKFGDCDVFTDLNGVTYEDLRSRSRAVAWKTIEVPVISTIDLLKAKRTGLNSRRDEPGGEQDISDIRVLEEMTKSHDVDQTT